MTVASLSLGEFEGFCNWLCHDKIYPTEKLFAYLENRDGDKFTIEILKSGLHDIDRKDIITNILVKHQVLGKSGHVSV